MRYVLQILSVAYAVKTLVGGLLVEWSKMRNVRANLHIVEVLQVYCPMQSETSAIPCGLDLRICVLQVSCQAIDFLRLCITTHESYAGDVLKIASKEFVEHGFVKVNPDVVPKVLAMATRAMAWTAGDVYGESHFSRYFLKDNSCVYVFHINRQ